MQFARVWVFAVVLAIPLGLPAIDSEDALPDPAAAALYERLVSEVRCLVCQNQTVADSSAPLAADLRREIRRMVEEGRTAEEIETFLVERYGDFVLYKPRFIGPTALLWGAPLLLVVGGAIMLGFVLRRRRSLPTDHDADEEVSAP
jgi:cytochrome c-type biogenesis protein CcmH